MTAVDCRYCDRRHSDSLLCPPAKRVLDALLERGQRFDMPIVEFPDPVITTPGAMGEGTVLVQQFTAKAALVEVAGTPQPVLILGGQAAGGQPLDDWYLPASPADLRKHVRMVSEVAEMAIRAVRQARGQA